MALPFAKIHTSYGRTAHTKCGMYLLGPSLAAALPAERRVLARRGLAGEKSGLFEHPTKIRLDAGTFNRSTGVSLSYR